ncbi:N-acetylmuramoyl-L-alanine amidase [Paenibacillus glufosinatiresistens]|uniref:N-acetylmuramoyl-L-alanine amidase n=1 Tax=Paenibacillus glufosinatiresistens TaxID=3070657 RepID=UPI00286D6B3C|nr:N-acetylmuramoyl-L-alanine amidase [Paenibacillus sp. YX.27]
MRRLVICCMLLLLLLPSAGQALASGRQPAIVVDGQTLSLQKKDKVENLGGSVMVPLRVIAENLGLPVSWEQATGRIVINREFGEIELTVGNRTAAIDGKSTRLEASPVNRGGTTLVPLRFIGEAMGLKVGWDNQAKIVSLTSALPAQTPQPSAVPTPSASAAPASPLPSATPAPSASASASAVVKDISFSENRLMITYEGAAQPVVSTRSAGSISVALPKTDLSSALAATSGFNLLTGTGDLPVAGSGPVTAVHYSADPSVPSTALLTLTLSGTSAPVYTTYTEGDGSTVLFVVQFGAAASAVPLPSMPAPVPGKKLVVLDPGHGDGDSGGVGAALTLEKNVNLSLALKVRDILSSRPDLQIVMTREDDTFIPLSTRAQIANQLHADAFISFHANKAPGKPTVGGTETYYYGNGGKSLAETMHRHLLAATGFKDRKVKTNRYVVLRETTMPATLMEVGFLSNPQEEAVINSADFQNRVAAAIADGILDYFHLNP